MRKSVLPLTMLGLLGVAPSYAVPITCPVLTTVAFLESLNATGGCDSQDKIYSNFTYTGADSADLISAKLIFQSSPIGVDIHGWTFTNDNASAQWLSGFTLGFTITVNSPNPATGIVASKDQIDSGLAGSGNLTSVVDTQTVGVLTTNGLSTANETTQLIYPKVLSVDTSTVATIPDGSSLIRYDQVFVEVAGVTVPETASFQLLAGGLLLLTGGGLRRYRRRG